MTNKIGNAIDKGRKDANADSQRASNFPVVKELLDIVGGNPNYNPPKDPVAREAYKESWNSTKKGK